MNCNIDDSFNSSIIKFVIWYVSSFKTADLSIKYMRLIIYISCDCELFKLLLFRYWVYSGVYANYYNANDNSERYGIRIYFSVYFSVLQLF